ncbi:MAG: metal-sulfur cluster assembly factor [Candidatus Micrarchaeota archaeon]
MATEAQIRAALKNVLDPEIGVNIVDMGLIYGIEEKGGAVRVTATLTYPGCPLGQQIMDEIKAAVAALEGVKRVEVEITFNPPWDKDMMSQDGRDELDLLRQSMY